MELNSVLIFFALVSGVKAERKYRPFMFFWTAIEVGDDPDTALRVNALPSFDFSHLILIDSTCGRPQGKCQRYCSDLDFTALYCGNECQSLAPQMATFICNADYEDFRYKANKTKALDEWKWQVPGWRKMYGKEYLEEFRLTAFPTEFQLTSQIRIVSSTSFDRRPLGLSYDAALGYGPGPGNPFYQITKNNNFAPLLTIAGNYWLYRSKLGRYLQPTTVGHLDMSRCVGWEFVKSLSPDRWVFPIEKVDFMGVGFGKAVGMFSHTLSSFVGVSSQVADRLMAEGVADFGGQTPDYLDTFRSLLPCDTQRRILPPVSFRVGDIDLLFNETAAFRGYYYREGKLACTLSLFVDHKSPHQNAEVWIFGKGFFREYCVAFDYEKLTIGFAKLRKWPFPYIRANETAQ